MNILPKDGEVFVLNYDGKKYKIIDRLVAFYLAKLKLRNENYNSVSDANKLLWYHYNFYINNLKQCESEAKINVKYIILSYKEFF